MVDILNVYILALFDLHTPVTRVVRRDEPKPCITDTVKLMMKLQYGALATALQKKTKPSKEYYRSLKILVTSTIEREKKE